MVRRQTASVTVDGVHLKSLYLLLSHCEEDLDCRLAELQTTVQRVLFETLSIDEIERLNDENDPDKLL
jgi:hypothetical protein